MKEKIVKERIENLYSEPCELLNLELEMGTGVYSARAYLLSDPEVRFNTDLNRKTGEIIRSNYPQLKWRSEYEKEVTKQIDLISDRYVHHVTFYSDAESKMDYSNILDYSEILNNDLYDNKTELRMYFFNEMNEDFWNDMRGLMQWNKDHGFKSTSYLFRFYDPQKTKDIKLDTQRFGFKSRGAVFFEHKHHDSLKSELMFTLLLNDPIPTEEQLRKKLNFKPNIHITRPVGF